MKKIAAVLIFLLISISLFSQEGEASAAELEKQKIEQEKARGEKARADKALEEKEQNESLKETIKKEKALKEEAEKKAAEAVKSKFEGWKENLKYGITEDVMKTVKELKEAGEDSLNPELTALFGETINDDLKLSILDFFTLTEYSGLEAGALKILEIFDDEPEPIVRKAINYLAAIKSEGLGDYLEELIQTDNDETASTAIRGAKKIDAKDLGEFLLEQLKDEEYPARRKPEIILALGELGTLEAVDYLIELVENEDEERIWRMYSLDSLGQIGDEKALPVIKAHLGDDEALIRAYAASALSHFNMEETVDVFIQALRDSNWKVRLQAAEGLADRRASKAVDILKFKVKKDPVKSVRLASIKTLGAIGSGESYDFLKELYGDDKSPYNIRDAALKSLLDQDPGLVVDMVKKLIEKEKAKPFGKAPVLNMTAKRLFQTESGRMEELYLLFLECEDWLVRVYGIRGAVKNRFHGMKGKIQELSEKDKVTNVKKEALTALEKY